MAGRKRRTFVEAAQQTQPKIEEKVVVEWETASRPPW